MATAKMTLEELKARLASLGLHPSDAALAQMWETLPALEAWQIRIRQPLEHAEESAHIFPVKGER